MRISTLYFVVFTLVGLAVPACRKAEVHHDESQHKIVVTSPVQKDVVSTERYVCQIHSRRHIEMRALEGGYLEEIPVREGRAVKTGDLMFKIVPTLYQAKLDAKVAEADLAHIELSNVQKLFQDRVVSDKEVALTQAKLAKAQAEVDLAKAELNFTEIRAPFDGIVDRLREQHGSLIEEGDILTTLSDNRVMWVYFNVPESRYLEYEAGLDNQDDDQAYDDRADEAGESGRSEEHDDLEGSSERGASDEPNEPDEADEADDVQQSGLSIELVLANGSTFPQPGKICAVEAEFNNETGNIAFRADFPNPDGLLRHGQTGTILIHRQVRDAIVIPQRATFDILAKHYVYVVGADGLVHQRDIVIGETLEDIYLITEGLDVNDRIVLEGAMQVRDGDKAEFEFRDPNEVLKDLKFKAE